MRNTASLRPLVAVAFFASLVVELRPGRSQSAPQPIEKDVHQGTHGEAEEDSVRTDPDGARTYPWYRLGSGVALKLRNEPNRDLMVGEDWPENLIQGPESTAGMVEVSRTYGRLTLRAGLGAGVTTVREGGAASGTPHRTRQDVAGVASAGATLKLPGRWSLDLGASASTTTGVHVGASATKKF